MLTSEDIKLLSQLMDEKLDEKLKPINERLDKVDKRLDNMDERLDNMDERLDNIDGRLDNIDERLDNIDERLDAIEENTEITRGATNEIIKWIDKYFRDDYPFPVDDKKAI